MLVLSLTQLFATQWIVAPQAPLPVEFFRHEYWTRLPFHPPGDLLNHGSNPHLLHWQAGFLPPAT